jgi:peptide/nickel transport system substrate-binding protein
MLAPRKGKARPTALLALVAALSFGCQRGREPGTLIIAIEQEPRGFDPRYSTGNAQSARIMQLIYDTLLVKDEKFELVPWLAERFEQSQDSTTFTFRLRQGVRFHDGRMLTSADVKYTFESILRPEARSPIRSSLEKLSAIEAPDPLTVIFRAREPFHTFLGNLPAIGIIPQGAGQEQSSKPIGTGPFRFVSSKEGQSIWLEANPHYWAGAPEIRKLQIRIIPDNSTRQAALMSGEVDLAYNAQFDPETIRALSHRHYLQVVIGNGSNIAHLGINLTSPVLSNKKVRQAIAHAIDRQSIIGRLLRGQARRADSILPPEQWAFEPMVKVYDYDPQLAKKLLDEAGYPDPDGDGPQPRFAITLMTSTAQLSRNIAAIMQEQLRRVGIKLNLQSLELATLLDRINKAQFDLYYLVSVGANQSTDVFQFVYHSRYRDGEFDDLIARLRAEPDPARCQQVFDRLAEILSRRDYCPNPEVDRLARQAAGASPASKKSLYLKIADMLLGRGGANRSRYCNPQVDRWIIEAERATDRATRKELYSKIQKALSEDLPQIYLWYPANVLVARTTVKNLRIEPSGAWYFISKLRLG